MQDFSYYSFTRAPYVTRKAVEAAMLEKINQAPMTKQERDDALNEMPGQVDAEYIQANRLFREERQAKQDEFWVDCREDLGYSRWMNLEGCRIIEEMAHSKAHAEGYAEIYQHLSGLVEMLRRLRPHLQPSLIH